MSEQRDWEGEAAALGHVPLSSWKGDPDKWVDAETFVTQAEERMPALRRTNQVLHQGMTALQNQMGAVTAELRATRASLKTLEDSYETDLNQRVEEARKDLVEQLKVARRNDNVDAEVEIQAQLAKMPKPDDKPAARSAEGQTPPNGGSGYVDPATQAWCNRNQALLMNPNTAMQVQAASMIVRAQQPHLVGQGDAFYAALDKELVNLGVTKGVNRDGESRVESGSGGTARPNTGARSYANLPPDAKQICDRQASRFVGPGKAHKDITSWRNRYAELYDWEG